MKEGVGETLNIFANGNVRYQRLFQGIHHLNILAGAQMLITQNKYEGGAGRNTPNDFYQTLGDTKTIGRYFYGYQEKWNWANFYAHADYTYRDMVAASLNVAADGASSAGTYGNHFYIYPSGGVFCYILCLMYKIRKIKNITTTVIIYVYALLNISCIIFFLLYFSFLHYKTVLLICIY